MVRDSRHAGSGGGPRSGVVGGWRDGFFFGSFKTYVFFSMMAAVGTCVFVVSFAVFFGLVRICVRMKLCCQNMGNVDLCKMVTCILDAKHPTKKNHDFNFYHVFQLQIH